MLAVSRMRIPEFVHDVIDDPRQRGILVAGSLALFAVGLVPRVLSPGLPNSQELLKAQPEVENLFLLLSFLSTAAVMIGGLVSDLFRHRALMVGALSTMAVAGVLSIVVDDGPLYYATNFVAVGAAGVVLAYGIGSVAITYEGVARATALGFVYAAYGGGSALAPAVLTLFPQVLPGAGPGGADLHVRHATGLLPLGARGGRGSVGSLSLDATPAWVPAGEPHARHAGGTLVHQHPRSRQWCPQHRGRGRRRPSCLSPVVGPPSCCCHCASDEPRRWSRSCGSTSAPLEQHLRSGSRSASPRPSR